MTATSSPPPVALTHVEIWTDGACSGNPGPGGWAAILVAGTRQRELSGGSPQTTNNRMELTAVIEALEALKRPAEVTLRTDSRLICDAYNKRWLASWQRRDWHKRSGEPVKNPDLWQRFLDASRRHRLTITWVKGHAADVRNNRCDELAVAARDAARHG